MGTYEIASLTALDRASNACRQRLPGRCLPHRSDAFPNVAGDRPVQGELSSTADSQEVS